MSNKELLVIANRAAGKITETVFSLDSENEWETTNVTKELKFGKVYLTTGVIRKDKVYVIHSNLKTLLLTPEGEKNTLNIKATIQQVLKIN